MLDNRRHYFIDARLMDGMNADENSTWLQPKLLQSKGTQARAHFN